jgi:hypothetical protein
MPNGLGANTRGDAGPVWPGCQSPGSGRSGRGWLPSAGFGKRLWRHRTLEVPRPVVWRIVHEGWQVVASSGLSTRSWRNMAAGRCNCRPCKVRTAALAPTSSHTELVSDRSLQRDRRLALKPMAISLNNLEGLFTPMGWWVRCQQESGGQEMGQRLEATAVPAISRRPPFLRLRGVPGGQAHGRW